MHIKLKQKGNAKHGYRLQITLCSEYHFIPCDACLRHPEEMEEVKTEKTYVFTSAGTPSTHVLLIIQVGNNAHQQMSKMISKANVQLEFEQAIRALLSDGDHQHCPAAAGGR